MATKGLLSELCDLVWRNHDVRASFDSAGGVEIARRVRLGATADIVVLAAEAMTNLEADGFLVSETVRSMFVSDVVAAVPKGRSSPPFSRAAIASMRVS